MKAPTQNKEYLVWGVEYNPPPHIMARNARRRWLWYIGWTLGWIVGLCAWAGLSLLLTTIVTSNVQVENRDDLILIRLMLVVMSLLMILAVAVLIASIVTTKRQHDMTPMQLGRFH